MNSLGIATVLTLIATPAMLMFGEKKGRRDKPATAAVPAK